MCSPDKKQTTHAIGNLEKTNGQLIQTSTALTA